MKPNTSSSVRPFGQRSLPSSFIFRPISISKTSNEETQTKPSKQSISLSDFLDRKLNKTTTQPIQLKMNPFSSIGSLRKDMGGREEGLDGGQVLDGAVFRQFKTLVNDQSCIGSDGGDDVGEPEIEVGGEDSRKRKRPCDIFADGHERPADKKYVVVLGDDPKPKQKKRDSNVMNDKKQRTFYNYYENGSGWWDEEREGVDNEEVGCNDVWEGMGSTTLGGLEWH